MARRGETGPTKTALDPKLLSRRQTLDLYGQVSKLVKLSLLSYRCEVCPAVIAAPEFCELQPAGTSRDNIHGQHETISSLVAFA
jgi:hypothetical protein